MTKEPRVDDLDLPEHAGNVTRWRDGQMARRWVAAGMLKCRAQLPAAQGCKDMPVLVAALACHAEEVGVQLSA